MLLRQCPELGFQKYAAWTTYKIMSSECLVKTQAVASIELVSQTTGGLLRSRNRYWQQPAKAKKKKSHHRQPIMIRYTLKKISVIRPTRFAYHWQVKPPSRSNHLVSQCPMPKRTICSFIVWHIPVWWSRRTLREQGSNKIESIGFVGFLVEDR